MKTDLPNFEDPLISGKLPQDAQPSSDCDKQDDISSQMEKLEGNSAKKKKNEEDLFSSNEENRSISIVDEIISKLDVNNKSCKVFDSMSKLRDIPVMHNYFCAKHGKAEADGAIGRLSMHLDAVVRSGSQEFSDAGEIVQYRNLSGRFCLGVTVQESAN